jgi:hypothetical protein
LSLKASPGIPKLPLPATDPSYGKRHSSKTFTSQFRSQLRLARPSNQDRPLTLSCDYAFTGVKGNHVAVLAKDVPSEFNVPN